MFQKTIYRTLIVVLLIAFIITVNGFIQAASIPIPPVMNDAFIDPENSKVPDTMVLGKTYEVLIRVNNIGRATWTDKSLYRLGTGSGFNGVDANQVWWSKFESGGYMLSLTNGRAYLPKTVAPREYCDFRFAITADKNDYADRNIAMLSVRMVQDTEGRVSQNPWFGTGYTWKIKLITDIPYSSIQCRLQRNAGDNWDYKKTIGLGDSIRIATMFDNSGQMANDQYIKQTVTGPNGWSANPSIGQTITPPAAGWYQVVSTTTNGQLVDKARFEVLVPITKKVLVLNYDPILENYGNVRLHQYFSWWQDPQTLVGEYLKDLTDASGGYVRWQITQFINIDEYPLKLDGFRYTDDSYLEACQTGQFHKPDEVDYLHIVNEYGLNQKVDQGEIDEVIMLGAPYFGYYESQMVGHGAYWCNSTGLEQDAPLYVIMGLSYERGVECALEDFGHRTESIMSHVYEKMGAPPNHLWYRFTRCEMNTPPGNNVACGDVHYPPNSTTPEDDYNYSNPRYVVSEADDWYYNYPDFAGATRSFNCDEWNGDHRQYMKWWFNHMPKTTGRYNDGVLNNWWCYLVDMNAYAESGGIIGSPTIAYWSFDQPNGSMVKDDSGNGATGYLFNGATSGIEPGKYGNAAQFDGMDDYMRVQDRISFHVTNQLTLSAWVKTDSPAFQNIVGKWNGDNSPYRIYIENGNYFFALTFSEDGDEWGAAVMAPITPGQWTQVTGVYDGTQMILYLNGQPVNVFVLPTGNNRRIADSPNPLYIGGLPNEDEFDGMIDELRIFGIGLDQYQVSQLQTACRNPLVAYWSFDKEYEGRILDESGNGADGLLQNGATSGIVPGRFGGSAYFNGNNASVLIPDRAAFHFTTAMTAAAWIKPERDQGQTIINKWYGPDTFSLHIENNNCCFAVAFVVNGEEQCVIVSAPVVIGEWNHVAGVYNGNELILYIGGQLAAITPIPADITDRNLMDSYMPLHIGSHPEWSGYLGCIDELRLYNQALTTEQIMEIKETGRNEFLLSK